MMPPFLPGRAPRASTAIPALRVPPLRLGRSETAPAEEEGPMAATPAAELADESLPWLLRPQETIDTEIEASEAGEEWETDSLAPLGLDEEWTDEDQASPEPAHPAFESDADLFERLLDELVVQEPDAEPGFVQGAAEIDPHATDPRRVEEIAARLERIARSLRERGPTGPLADQGADPLGALVTGYLLGLAEREPPGGGPR